MGIVDNRVVGGGGGGGGGGGDVAFSSDDDTSPLVLLEEEDSHRDFMEALFRDKRKGIQVAMKALLPKDYCPMMTAPADSSSSPLSSTLQHQLGRRSVLTQTDQAASSY
jgi:hypothetical protein